MTCPGCSSKMETRQVGSLEIDLCMTCGGSWFDEGELRRLIDIEQPIVDSFFKAHDTREEAKAMSERRCPKCERSLEKYTYCYSSHISLDNCPDCGGIFVDKGEVDQIESYLEGLNRPDPKADLGLAVNQLNEATIAARQRAYSLIHSVWTRRMVGSRSYSELFEDTDVDVHNL